VIEEIAQPGGNGSSVRIVPTSAGQDIVGTVGRITVAVRTDRPGEVVLAVRGGTEAFAAWADEPLGRNTRVLVIEQISARSVHVTALP
jgi:hypothetical protein